MPKKIRNPKSESPSAAATPGTPSATLFPGVDFYSLDELLSPGDIELRSRVRDWVQTRYLPIIAEHYAKATFPLVMGREIAAFGAFGGSISGYGCAGLSPLQYGLIMQELERG